jgi:hypothetical protein
MKELPRSSVIRARVERGEWRFVGLVALTILSLTSLPYIFGALSAPPDRHFMGFILNVSDHSQYLAWYKAFQTHFLISNNLTPEPNPRVFFNLLWWTLGRFGYYTGLHYAVVYQIFRWVAGGFFLAAVYGFVSLILDDVLRRRTAFLVIALGAGFGWVLVLLKYTLTRGELLFPLDVYIAEGNSFLCLMAYPHFAEAAGLILVVFWLLLVGEERQRSRYAVFAGLAAHFLGWQHGYDLLIVWVVPAAYAGLRLVLERRWPLYWVRALPIVVLLSWPPAVYAVLLTRLSPVWREVLAQFSNAGVYSPLPQHMVILMGLPLIAAVVTLVVSVFARLKAGSRSSPAKKELFVMTWFVIGWALVYVPADFQVHMINSWQVPIGLLATMGLYRYVVPALRRRWSSSRVASLAGVALLLLIIPTNLYLWAWRFYDLNRHDYPYYLYRDEVAAMRWLGDQAAPEAVVLSAYDTGRYVPSLASRRAFLSHWAQTVDFHEKRDAVEEFFVEDTDDGRRQEILQEHGVAYVLHGPAEQALGSYTPETSSFLSLAFSTPRVKVYEVRAQGGE